MQRNQSSNFNIHLIIEKAKEFQKYIYFCFIDYAKSCDCVNHKLWKILKMMGIPDHLTCLKQYACDSFSKFILKASSFHHFISDLLGKKETE